MSNLITLSGFAVWLGACGACPGPVDHPEPGPPPVDQTACQRACAVLALHKCPEALPSPSGRSCVATCEAIEDSGFISLDPLCVAEARSLADVRACDVRCPAPKKD
jgi:hypothetical protein